MSVTLNGNIGREAKTCRLRTRSERPPFLLDLPAALVGGGGGGGGGGSDFGKGGIYSIL